MNTRVAVAGQHGSTREIAEAVAQELHAGLAVALRQADQVDAVDGNDDVVLGSAISMGHWLEPAQKPAERHADALVARACWLFSSGPIGNPPMSESPVDVSAITAAVRPREHRVFAGKLDRRGLGFGEKALTRALRRAERDLRDWPEIRDCVRGIAATLTGAARDVMPVAAPPRLMAVTKGPTDEPSMAPSRPGTHAPRAARLPVLRVGTG